MHTEPSEDRALAQAHMHTVLARLAGLGFSHEGKNYWMLKAAPISTRQLLTAKFLVGYLPALLLCLAALNTPIERASANVFLAVLRDSLGAKRKDSDMLLPRVDLSALFPDAAIAWLQKHGAKVMPGVRATRVRAEADNWVIEAAGMSHRFRHVVIATSASHAQGLLDDVDPALARALERYKGDFLEDEAVGEWALEPRERWRRLYVS